MRAFDKEMDFFTQDDLQVLLKADHGLCVSVYMPTHRFGPEIQQDPLRLSHLLDRAQEDLIATGMRTPEARDLLAPARALQENVRSQFWQHQSDGLALFIGQDTLLSYRLPLSFPERAVVNERFYVKPLIPLLTGDGLFGLLTLSQNGVHFYQGTKFSIEEVELREAPSSLEDELRYDEFERQLQFRSTSSSGTGQARRAAMFHGHGSAGEESSVRKGILRFLNSVDDHVGAVLANRSIPVVLAGVDYMRGYYREVSQLQHLTQQDIDADPQSLEVEELHRRAWAIVEPGFAEARQLAEDRFRQLYGNESPQAAFTVETIVPAAHYQRVDTLFVPADVQMWGSFDADTGDLDIHGDPKPGDDDLLDSAVARTLLNGGVVYSVASEEMPYELPVAAILRY